MPSSVRLMSQDDDLDGSDRWSQVDRSLDDAVARAELTGAGTAMRDALAGLRGHLHRMHIRPQEVGQLVWAAYVADLDRGLAEFQIELTRTAERPHDGPSVEDVVYARLTQFEVNGWALRLAAIEDQTGQAPSSIEEASALVPACGVELASFREACATGRPASRDKVDGVVQRLASAVVRAEGRNDNQ